MYICISLIYIYIYFFKYIYIYISLDISYSQIILQWFWDLPSGETTTEPGNRLRKFCKNCQITDSTLPTAAADAGHGGEFLPCPPTDKTKQHRNNIKQD